MDWMECAKLSRLLAFTLNLTFSDLLVDNSLTGFDIFSSALSFPQRFCKPRKGGPWYLSVSSIFGCHAWHSKQIFEILQKFSDIFSILKVLILVVMEDIPEDERPFVVLAVEIQILVLFRSNEIWWESSWEKLVESSMERYWTGHMTWVPLFTGRFPRLSATLGNLQLCGRSGAGLSQGAYIVSQLKFFVTRYGCHFEIQMDQKTRGKSEKNGRNVASDNMMKKWND